MSSEQQRAAGLNDELFAIIASASDSFLDGRYGPDATVEWIEKRILDQHAHELAERIRAELGCERTRLQLRDGCWGSDCCGTAEDAARLIDPA